jgi:hypothetical protein
MQENVMDGRFGVTIDKNICVPEDKENGYTDEEKVCYSLASIMSIMKTFILVRRIKICKQFQDQTRFLDKDGNEYFYMSFDYQYNFLIPIKYYDLFSKIYYGFNTDRTKVFEDFLKDDQKSFVSSYLESYNAHFSESLYNLYNFIILEL